MLLSAIKSAASMNVVFKGNAEGINQFSLEYFMKVGPHDPKALVRAADSLAFLVRDTAHITPANFEICVDAIRAFVEASINGVNKLPSVAEQRKKPKRNRRSKSSATDEQPEMESNTEEYHKVSMQLLELMQTLHTRAGRIFRSWGEEHPEQSIDIGALWDAGWCPLLQVIHCPGVRDK